MSYLHYNVLTTRDSRLERFEEAMRRSEGSRARAARARRRLSEESWR